MTEFRYVGDELDVFAGSRNWKEYFAGLLQKRIKGRVLEVGAGIGATTRALWTCPVVSWTCLEPDAQLAARIPGALLNKVPEIIVGTIGDLDETRQFDTILYVDVLEHITDDREEVRRAVCHLAPGGSIIALSPAFQALYSEFDRAIGHERRYSGTSLAAIFPPGLTQSDLFYADSAGALLSFANRLLLRSSLPTARQVWLWDRFVVPISRVVDPVIGRRFGRSIIAVYSRPARAPTGGAAGGSLASGGT